VSVVVERKGQAVVAWAKGAAHQFYEDRYRLLPKEIPLVSKQNRGEIFAVFDGIGSAPKGMSAAQYMADQLIEFYRKLDDYDPTVEGLLKLLYNSNLGIYEWGLMPGTDRPLGGCAGTIIWIKDGNLTVLHAGDTVGMMIRDGRAVKLTSAHEHGGAIYRYFGFGQGLIIDKNHFQIQNGDLILLFSDGVTKVFSPMSAAELIMKYWDAEKAVFSLAEESRIEGSQDDITVVLIEIEE
jgi:PPM family protein phosphatase